VDISFVFQERLGQVPQPRSGDSEELKRIRYYSVGDAFHHIHWKATAKLGKLMVREFAGHQQRSFTVIFDNSVNADVEPLQPGGVAEKQFELSVSAIASLVSHLCSHGMPFRLITSDVVFPHAYSKEQLREVLTHLAVVALSRKPKLDLPDWARKSLRSGDIVLVVPGKSNLEWRSLVSPSVHLIDPVALTVERRAASA
jgi:uncharacterized protein (DUF58 family)